MRIVAGTFRGRALVAPKGQATRPTADRARQALFDMLVHAPWSPGLQGRRVMDLFAGSGALGLEALSRGAVFCLFVETDEAARGAIRSNIESLDPSGGLFGATRVHRRSAADLGQRPAGDGAAFDLAFLDPPYGGALGEATLAGLARGGWLSGGAIAVLERGAGEPLTVVERFEPVASRPYGAARFDILRFG